MPASEMTAEEGHEAEVGAHHQQADDDADHAQWDGDEDDQRPAQGVELGHQQQDDDQRRDRQLLHDRGVGLGRLLLLATELPGVAQRPGGALLLEPGHQLLVDLAGGEAQLEVGLDGDRLQPVARRMLDGCQASSTSATCASGTERPVACEKTLTLRNASGQRRRLLERRVTGMTLSSSRYSVASKPEKSVCSETATS